MKKCISFILFILIIITSTQAVRYESQKNALKDIFSGYSKVMKKDVKLSKSDAEEINAMYGGGHRKNEKFSIYYAKNDSGEVDLYALTMLEILDQYAAYHTWVIVFDKDFVIKEVVVLELTDEYTYGMSSPVFLDQFQGKKHDECEIADTVDAVSGATMSSELFVLSLKKARHIINKQIF